MSTKLKLMSHNVWNNDYNKPVWEKNGEDCSAEARTGKIFKVYKEILPDIIGCQEMSARMLDLLKEECNKNGLNYSILWGRFTPILFNSEKFALIDSVFCTYPKTIPNLKGYFNDSMSKSYNIGVFCEKQSKKIFVFATTHLWWKSSEKSMLKIRADAYQEFSDEAREYQINLLQQNVKKYCKKYNCPAIVVGDFNTGYFSKAIQLLLKNNFYHAHDIAFEYSEQAVGLHNCYPWGYETYYFNKPFEEAIDHILVFGDIKNYVKNFKRFSPDWYFPISDHSPCYIEIEI